MTPDDEDDLIGDVPPPRGRGRPSNAEKAEREAQQRVNLEAALRTSQFRVQGRSALGDAYAVQNGVNVTWLSQAFRMDLKTVRRKLAPIEPIGTGARGAEIYDFVEAVRYLAKPPPGQLGEFLRGLRVQDLPIHLQDPYWSAMRKKQIYELHARQLWKTEDVLDVLGETFKTVKATMQLWVDNLDAQSGLTPEQRVLVTRMVDGLQDEIYARLVEMPKHRQTGSLADSPEANPVTPELADEDEDMIG